MKTKYLKLLAVVMVLVLVVLCSVCLADVSPGEAKDGTYVMAKTEADEQGPSEPASADAPADQSELEAAYKTVIGESAKLTKAKQASDLASSCVGWYSNSVAALPLTYDRVVEPVGEAMKKLNDAIEAAGELNEWNQKFTDSMEIWVHSIDEASGIIKDVQTRVKAGDKDAVQDLLSLRSPCRDAAASGSIISSHLDIVRNTHGPFQEAIAAYTKLREELDKAIADCTEAAAMWNKPMEELATVQGASNKILAELDKVAPAEETEAATEESVPAEEPVEQETDTEEPPAHDTESE